MSSEYIPLLASYCPENVVHNAYFHHGVVASYSNQMGRPLAIAAGVIGSVAVEFVLAPTAFVAVAVQV